MTVSSTGPGFRSASYAFDGSRIVWAWNEEQGRAGLERAVAYAKAHDGAARRWAMAATSRW